MFSFKPSTFFCAAILFLTGCGTDSSTQINANNNSFTVNAKPAIANGFEQPPEASPQIVEVVAKNSDGSDLYLCSGTVIAPERVLTAGHCIEPTGLPMEVRTVAGIYQASSAVIAPGYSVAPELDAIFNDAAIMIVPGLNLPALSIISSTQLVGNESLLVFGYGLDENNGYGVLKAGGTVAQLVTPNHIFGPIADGSLVNPCSGDSGGPLAWPVMLASGESVTGIVGIISTGTGDNCNSGAATLYTNLQSPGMIDFIISHAPGVIIQ